MSLSQPLQTPKRFYFKSLNLKMLLLLKNVNNYSNIIQLQKETAPPSRRKMSDWSTRDVTLPNSKWRQYIYRLLIPVLRRLIVAQYELQMHVRIFLEQPRLFIILFHLFLWDSFPAMLVFWLIYRIQLWTLHDHEGQQYF